MSPEPAPPAAPSPLREPGKAELRLAEAIVFASLTPVTARALSQMLPDDVDAIATIAALRARYEGRGIELVEVGGGLQFRTAPDLAPELRKSCGCRGGCQGWRWRRWRSWPTISR